MTISELIKQLQALKDLPNVESDQCLVSLDSGMDEPLLYGIYNVEIRDGHVMIGLKEDEI